MWVVTLKLIHTKQIICKIISTVKTYQMPKLIWQDRMALREIAMALFYQVAFKMEEVHTFLLQIEEGTKASRSKNVPKV